MSRKLTDEQILAAIKQLEKIGDANTKSIELLHYRLELRDVGKRERGQFNWGFWKLWRLWA